MDEDLTPQQLVEKWLSVHNDTILTMLDDSIGAPAEFVRGIRQARGFQERAYAATLAALRTAMAKEA